MLRAWAADATPILSRPISVDDFDSQTGALTFLYQVKGRGHPEAGRAGGRGHTDSDRPLRQRL